MAEGSDMDSTASHISPSVVVDTGSQTVNTPEAVLHPDLVAVDRRDLQLIIKILRVLCYSASLPNTVDYNDLVGAAMAADRMALSVYPPNIVSQYSVLVYLEHNTFLEQFKLIQAQTIAQSQSEKFPERFFAASSETQEHHSKDAATETEKSHSKDVPTDTHSKDAATETEKSHSKDAPTETAEKVESKTEIRIARALALAKASKKDDNSSMKARVLSLAKANRKTKQLVKNKNNANTATDHLRLPPVKSWCDVSSDDDEWLQPPPSASATPAAAAPEEKKDEWLKPPPPAGAAPAAAAPDDIPQEVQKFPKLVALTIIKDCYEISLDNNSRNVHVINRGLTEIKVHKFIIDSFMTLHDGKQKFVKMPNDLDTYINYFKDNVNAAPVFVSYKPV